MFFNKSKKLLAEANEQLAIKQQELEAIQATLVGANAKFNTLSLEYEQRELELGNCIVSRDALEQLKEQYKANVEDLERKNTGLRDELSLKESIVSKYSTIIDKDQYLAVRQAETDAIKNNLQELNAKFVASLAIHEKLEKQISLYQDSLEIGSFGLYQPQFDFETSDMFKEEIQRNYEAQKQLIKDDKAVVCYTEWTVGGSVAEGRKMTNQYKKLMLYAFNGECDALIAKVKWNNAAKITERMSKAYENINKLGVTQNVQITITFLDLKKKELALTYEYEQKKYEEKEEQRRIREQMREEEKAQKELERAQKEAEDEERRFEKALDRAKAELGNASAVQVEELNAQVLELEQKLQEAHDRKERAIALAQLTKVGHIYIISNIGSFGEDVYKIGMTRRLDPLDRVKELGDASVPFQFDIHAIIYSENAPQLESELHQQFANNRLNRINTKKEFFKVTLPEIEAFVHKHSDAKIQFTKLAEAKEYRETLSLLKKLTQAMEGPKVESMFPASLV